MWCSRIACLVATLLAAGVSSIRQLSPGMNQPSYMLLKLKRQRGTEQTKAKQKDDELERKKLASGQERERRDRRDTREGRDRVRQRDRPRKRHHRHVHPERQAPAEVADGCMSNCSDIAKRVTFIRHGISAGNAGLHGVFEKGSMFAYKDGELMIDGENQAKLRVDLMNNALLERVSKATVVLVSPLRRAIATAIIVVAKAAHRQRLQELGIHKGCVNLHHRHRWPKFKVVTEMREKIESDSDRPARIPLDYLSQLATKIGDELFCRGNATGFDQSGMRLMIDNIFDSWTAEERASYSWKFTPLDMTAGASNALSFMGMITAFTKKFLHSLNDTDVLMVGHNAWARFAFSTLLPSPELPGPGTVLENLVAGGRTVYPLNNCGVLALTYQNGLFQADRDHFPELFRIASEGPLPNFNAAKTKTRPTLFRTDLEAKVAAMIPRDASIARFNVYVRKMFGWGKHLITISAAPAEKVAYLAWSSKWGQPKGAIELKGSDFSITDQGGLVYRINGKTDSVDIKAMSIEDFEAVGLLLSKNRVRIRRI